MKISAEFSPDKEITPPAGERSHDRVRAMVSSGTAAEASIDDIILDGVPPSAMDALMQYASSTAELDWIVPSRTLKRRKASQSRLTVEESDRWFRAARTLSLATTVFASEEKAKRWLHKPMSKTLARTPAEMMRTEHGAEQVRDFLYRIDSGYFA